MSRRRHVRMLGLQALYQIDVRGEDGLEQIAPSIDEAPYAEQTRAEALAMAQRVWSVREQADALAAELAPSWPTHRQPPVDRAIIRIAYYDMAVQELPPSIAINEAVELAKTFGSEHSPAFLNGVLDKMARRLRKQSADPTEV